jgi:hypothetical protein
MEVTVLLYFQGEDMNWPRRKKSELMVGKILVPEYQLPGYRLVLEFY